MTKPMILIVDDERFCREAIAALLLKEGYSVKMAPDADLALVAVQTCHPDLMIIDQNMPHMSGLELAETVRHNAHYAKTGIIMLTGDGHRDHVKRAVELKVDDYMLKSGFSAHDLLHRVNRFFGRADGPTPPPAKRRPAEVRPTFKNATSASATASEGEAVVARIPAPAAAPAAAVAA